MVCGIKLLLINFIDFDVVGNVVKMVNQVKILVIIFDCQVIKGDVVSYIVFDNVQGGKMVGDYIVKKVGESVKVIELQGIVGIFVVCECGEGFKQVVVVYKFNVLVSQLVDFDCIKGFNVMQNLLIVYFDVQVVFV